jgi:hypothetical protein
MRDAHEELGAHMTDGRIARLRTSLDVLTPEQLAGPARTAPLIELARLLLERFHQHRGQPATLDLDEAYHRLGEAYTRLPAGTLGRAQVAGQLGNICAFRSAFTGISLAQLDIAIGYHDEAIGHPDLPVAGRELLLVLSALPRALRALPSADQLARLGRTDMRSLLHNMSWLANGLTPQCRYDLDLATERLQRVLAGPAADPQVQQLAGQLRQLTVVIRGVFGVDGPLGMANALGGLQLLWGNGVAGSGRPGIPLLIPSARTVDAADLER